MKPHSIVCNRCRFTVVIAKCLAGSLFLGHSVDFVHDNPGELVPEETFTHSHLSWLTIVPYLFHSSNMIRILHVQSDPKLPAFPQSISP